uniref:RNase H type-1 domain-containing protein n=1 Tax=Oryza nivara TaxID=4536 RepID=A0A0E0GIX3_ORYNI
MEAFYSEISSGWYRFIPDDVDDDGVPPPPGETKERSGCPHDETSERSRRQGGNGRRRLTLAPSWTTSSKGLAASLSPAKSSSEECERACFRLGRLVEAAAASATRPRAVHGSSAAFDQFGRLGKCGKTLERSSSVSEEVATENVGRYGFFSSARATHWLRFWAQLQRCEDDGEFLKVACRRLKSMVIQLFANYGWRVGFCNPGSCGECCACCAGRIDSVQDALSAEAVACLHALRAAVDHGFSHISVETGSVTLVNALESSCCDRTTAGVIFRQIKAMIHLDFVMITVSFTSRSCNNCAHELLIKKLVGTRVICPFGLTPSQILYSPWWFVITLNQCDNKEHHKHLGLILLLPHPEAG